VSWGLLLELFADEIEDMPPDTVVVEDSGLYRTADGAVCTVYPEAIQWMVLIQNQHNQTEAPCDD